MNADAIIFVKNVDGVYSGDPKTDAKAVKYEEISFDRIISEKFESDGHDRCSNVSGIRFNGYCHRQRREKRRHSRLKRRKNSVQQ